MSWSSIATTEYFLEAPAAALNSRSLLNNAHLRTAVKSKGIIIYWGQSPKHAFDWKPPRQAIINNR